ncbi:MAG: hypothetical protein JSR83_12435 [Proteobacteria bacterium]|nr:hypothetical protein [Pseudomonadota bacterium]
MADALSLWRQLLQVQEPWTVLDCRADEFNRCMDVYIGVEAPRSWFGFGRGKPVESGPEVMWRHIGFGGWKVQVRVRPPLGSELPRQQWAGEAGMPFTRALDRQILSLLNEGVGMAGVCTLLEVPMGELWRYRYALDKGQHGVGEAAPAQEAGTQRPLSAVLAYFEDGVKPLPGSQVPSLTDPVWLRLVDGTLNIDVRVLSLQLLLSRIRSQVAVIADEEVRMMKLRDLHRYFVKNERMLSHELQQLSKEAA